MLLHQRLGLVAGLREAGGLSLGIQGRLFGRHDRRAGGLAVSAQAGGFGPRRGQRLGVVLTAGLQPVGVCLKFGDFGLDLPDSCLGRGHRALQFGVAVAERSQLTAPGHEAVGGCWHAHLERAVDRKALAAPCDHDRA